MSGAMRRQAGVLRGGEPRHPSVVGGGTSGRSAQPYVPFPRAFTCCIFQCVANDVVSPPCDGQARTSSVTTPLMQCDH
jgi:hypothetical protein